MHISSSSQEKVKGASAIHGVRLGVGQGCLKEELKTGEYEMLRGSYSWEKIRRGECFSLGYRDVFLRYILLDKA